MLDMYAMNRLMRYHPFREEPSVECGGQGHLSAGTEGQMPRVQNPGHSRRVPLYPSS